VNGISLAQETAKLGIQKNLLVPKSLSSIVKGAFGSMISLVNCIIVKKYAITFSEFKNGKNASDKAKIVNRSLQTAEYI